MLITRSTAVGLVQMFVAPVVAGQLLHQALVNMPVNALVSGCHQLNGTPGHGKTSFLYLMTGAEK